jgi:predicted aconitase with swiveling domain
MRTARGSSSSSSALVEAVRRGTAPAAIVVTRPDPILVIGSLVAADLYGRELPVVILRDDDWTQLRTRTCVAVESRSGVARITVVGKSDPLLAERADPAPPFRS